nr:PREDICTED: adhesion G protein-coupled receptor F5-like [Latimeria chalumnae]|eukprot:XP_006014093.2 PREDICTED: adhesion G protein-coupled receptor F5-like [Latimeria chalumnae]
MAPYLVMFHLLVFLVASKSTGEAISWNLGSNPRAKSESIVEEGGFQDTLIRHKRESAVQYTVEVELNLTKAGLLTALKSFLQNLTFPISISNSTSATGIEIATSNYIEVISSLIKRRIIQLKGNCHLFSLIW